jgi:hypothetical protein
MATTSPQTAIAPTWLITPHLPKHGSRLLLAGLLSLAGLFPNVTAARATISQATAAARVEQRQQQLRQVVPENYDLSRYPVTNANERYWRNILWTTAVVEPQEAFVAEAVDRILQLATRPGLTESQQRTIDMAMQVGTQLYLSQHSIYARLQQPFLEIVYRSPNPQWVAMALSALQKGEATVTDIQRLSSLVQQRFPNWRNHIHLVTTLQDLAEAQNPAPLPPLKDLLEWSIAAGEPQLYVICQRDRGLLCLSILKDGNGQLVREPVAALPDGHSLPGQLWSVPLLLESIHSLSWNFTRGQTPQGIYRIEGTVPQPDLEFFRAYGQFPLVNLFVPRESGVKAFLPGRRGTISNLAAYQALLPPSWRNYFPIQQSYWAGKSGRGLFRIHGSGEAPSFFSGKQTSPDSFKWNPTIGCLSALEIYDDAGRLLESDMPKILNALTQSKGANFSGYLIVVEIPGTPGQPLSLATIETALNGTPTSGDIARPIAPADSTSSSP